MLKINIPELELFDEATSEFTNIKPQLLSMEHSLVAISKWESIYHEPFLATENKTIEETLEYLKCMTITQNVNPLTYKALPSEVIEEITDYISNPMSATTFSNINQKPDREIVTSELIYYWMTAYQIPFECEKWNIHRLMNLIKICSIKNAPPKKMSKSEILARNQSLNAARRAALGTKG